MPTTLAPLLTFLGVVLGLVSVYSLLGDLWLTNRTRIGQRIDEEFRREQRQRVQKSALFKNQALLGGKRGGADEEPRGWRARLETVLEQAALHISLRTLFVATAGCAIVSGSAVQLWRGNWPSSAAAALVAACLPLGFVCYRRRQRLDKLQQQIPEALDTLTRSLRAGHTLDQAFRTVAAEFKPPIAVEFACSVEQQNLGLSLEIALRDLGRRTGLLELKVFVMAVLVQQETGGSLTEVLDKLASVTRERLRMRGRVKTLTAEGRLQALLLMALPPLLFVVLVVIKPGYLRSLLDRPELLAATVGLQLIGALWIRKVTRLNF